MKAHNTMPFRTALPLPAFRVAPDYGGGHCSRARLPCRWASLPADWR